MAKKNTNLSNARNAKNDEFYTRFEDISKELAYYKDFFKDKVVYCNCDRVDGENRSNFFVYFATYFEILGLKRLICTTYNKDGKGKLFLYDGDTNANKIIDDEEIYTEDMDGDGDFRSEECVKWLKKCDVVVTNPPFSLFREFVSQLIEYNKNFLIIGNKNAITCKDIFPLIKDNKMWLGVTSPEDFIQPKGDKKKNMKGLTRWFTNIEHKKRTYPLDLYKKYSEEKYPKYDNYDAIHCEKVVEIPCDYNGVMGVPITFLDKFCPTQFEIVDARHFGLTDKQKNKTTMLVKDTDGTINSKPKYAHILIRRK